MYLIGIKYMETTQTNPHKEKFRTYLTLSCNPSTVRQYLWAYDKYLCKINTQDDVDKYLIGFINTESNKANSFYIGALRAYIDCFGLPLNIPRNRRKNTSNKTEYKFLEKDDVDYIINRTEPITSHMVGLYFETGLRLRELTEAKNKDININDRSISGVGKGNKKFIVYFSKESAEWIEPLLNKEYPFHFRDVKHHARSFQYHLKKQCEGLGIKGMHIHKVRHALGHFLRVEKGFDLVQIKEVLRHSDIGTTEIYSTATKEEIKRKMEEVFEDGKKRNIK